MSNIRYTDEKFKTEVIQYLDKSWQEIKSVTAAAEHFGYTERHFNSKFRKCFGIPFQRCLSQLRLRRAAMIMQKQGSLTGIRKMLGFASSQSLNKAFRHEFGVAPKEFLKGNYEIPDLPVEYWANGRKVCIAYEEKEQLISEGELLCAESIDVSQLLEKCGYCLDHAEASLPGRDHGDAQISFWWSEQQYKLYCYVGNVCEKAEMSGNKTFFTIPADYYAVLSIDRLPPEEETLEDVSLAIKELARIAFREWAVINRKSTKKMGYTYERYTSDQISLYVPVYRIDADEMKEYKSAGPVAWIEYIDEHITDKITVRNMADRFNYSEGHFRDTFGMFYGIKPQEYIRKRKLSLMVKELKEEKTDVECLAKRYGYHSEERFRKAFADTFGQMPEEYTEATYRAENLASYYSDHKDTIRVEFVTIEDTAMAGRKVVAEASLEYTTNDLIECICFRLQENLSGRGTPQIVIWKDVPDTETQVCLYGSEVHIKEPVPDDVDKVLVTGGRFVVLQSIQENDEVHLVDTYRMLYRCAFFGWVKENWLKVDMRRLTFVRYEKGKLQFYIPVFE